MEVAPQDWRRRLFRDRWVVASVASVSIAAGLIVAGTVLQRRRLKAELAGAPQDAAAAKLKPAFARRLAELRKFKERVGHSDVPLGSASGSKLVPTGLGKWVYAQRKRKVQGKLDQAEEAALVALGISWSLDTTELEWDEMIRRLVEYKEANGNCFVPKKYEADPLLGAWVASCRRDADPLLNGGVPILADHLRDELTEVGFAWEPEKRCGSAFMTGFRKWSEAKVAGKPVPDEEWCKTMRETRRQGKLSDQRVSYLDKFNFDWGLQAAEATQ
jgi:hypothetical protein